MSPRLWELRSLDGVPPLIAGEPPLPIPKQKSNRNAIPGDIDEMLPIFEACLQVGKLDRAALVLKRLAKNEVGLRVTVGIEIIELHNQYLQAMVEQLQTRPVPGAAEQLHKWYELEIRGSNIDQTPETIAYMLKASLLTAHGSRLERLIDRYMGMAPGDTGLAVLYMTGILNDQDRAKITDVCQTYNFTAEAYAPASELSNVANPATTAPGTSAFRTSDTPEVLRTPQKGMGLRVLQETLSLFSEIPEGRNIAALSREEQREIQMRLERDCVEAAVERWREENEALMKMGLNTSLSAASLNSRLFDWHTDLEKRISQELVRIEAAEAAETKSAADIERCMYGPFFRQSAPSRLAAVAILSTMSSLAMHGADKGVPVGIVINQLSKVAEEDIRAQQREKESAIGDRKPRGKNAAKAATQKILRQTKTAVPKTTADTQTGEEAKPNTIDPTMYRDTSWPATIRMKVGAAMLSALIETAKITVVKDDPGSKTLLSQAQPAFSRSFHLRKGKKIGVIIPNPALVELMKREPRGDMLARHLPMVAEPEPWTGFDRGGFLEYPAPLVRVKGGDREQIIYTRAAVERGDMDQMLKGLDVLGRTAWNINRQVLSVMLEAWNTGEAIADIPPLSPNIAIPPEPDSSEDPMQRRVWIKQVKAAENEKSGLHSVRCFMNLQLEIARAFRDQTFYFPHNVDFRGRAYPVPPYLNHMGADHVRGLLCFSQGKELGERGLRWLKVQLANVYGYDKASLADREAFAIDNMANIVDSATNPLHGQRWWLKAEDPWQCLAACFELKAAFDMADPTKYVSHLPVHQDGTCNGLQHYAALGGDSWGARQVNLEPGDRPADVYSAVAELVKDGIGKDAESGNPLAKALIGKITRKVVKQTVMTNVYGVTFAGAQKQVMKQLDSLYPNLYAQSGYDASLLSSYIATKIFKALSSMFRGAHDIQYWLGECGRRVCRSVTPEQLKRIEQAETNPKSTKSKTLKAKTTKASDEVLTQFQSTLVWTTPLRMPVAQPYRKASTKSIRTCLQDLSLSVPDRSDPVHSRKQLQAFPPNFIHSLDASHMILSALECDEKGLVFAAVHDSFWTHAADVDTMNTVLRDAFIRIHREDVIGRLASEFKARYGGSLYLAKLDQDSPAGKKISEFRKKKRVSLKSELLLEKKRQELLNSGDAALVAEGQAMVTPGSIFDEMSATEETDSEDLVDNGLGVIPEKQQASSEALENTRADEADEHGGDEGEPQHHEQQEDRLQKLIGTGYFDIKLHNSVPKKKQVQKATVQLWLPLTFPSIPEKGDFDVRVLKTSDYFFS